MVAHMTQALLEVFDNADAVAMRMAALLIEVIKTSPEPKVRIALSGGSTPQRLFEILAEPAMAQKIDWSRLEIFYGDERHVPVDHSDSNHKMAWETLLSKVPLKATQIHNMPTSASVKDDALSYQKTLQKVYGRDTLEEGRPLFDIVMLGLGTDGHTASLFPGEKVLEEKQAWVSSAMPKTAPHERLTLTYPAIQSSRLVVFLVTGANKVPMLKRLREADETIPSGRITSEGTIMILADRAAAGES